jgi:hypothetical protein
MKIQVTSSCYIALRGQPGRTYTEGEIVEASDELAKEFFSHGRARRLKPDEIAAAEAPAGGRKARASKPARETAAQETPGATGQEPPATPEA